MTTRSREEQFSGFKLWVNILEKFYTGVSLSRHGTFTGKQAADYLLKILPTIVIHKECNREMAVNLLKFFLRDGYFFNANIMSDNTFYDNGVISYKFCNGKVDKYIEDSGFGSLKKVRRTSSLKIQNGARNEAISRQDSSLQRTASFKNDDTTCSTKLSLSCNNLSDASKADLTKQSNSMYLVQNTKKNLKFLADSVLKSSENIKNSSLMARGVSPLIQRMSSRYSDKSELNTKVIGSYETKTSPSVTRNRDVLKTCAITEADEFKLWSYCLTERFKQASGGLSLTHEFSGADVCWNCKAASARGIIAKLPERVGKFEQNLDFPAILIDDLRRLSNWSISTVSVNSQLENDDSFQNNSFKASSEAIAVKNVLLSSNLRHLSSSLHLRRPLSPSITSSPSLSSRRSQTEPAQLFSRIAIMLVKCKFVPLIDDNVATSLFAIFNQMQHDSKTKNFGEMRNLTARPSAIDLSKKFPRSIENSKSTANSRLDSNHHRGDCKFQIDGVESSGINDRIKNCDFETESSLTSSKTIQTRSQTNKLMLNKALISAIPAQKRQKFFICVQLCLLTLEPPSRRKLQILMLYLERILRNNEIRLHEEKDNRTYILERFSAFFIEPKGCISELISAKFLAFFLDNGLELFFKVPQWLEADVRQKVDNIVSGKEVLNIVGSVVSVTRYSYEGVYNNRVQRSRASNTPPAQMTRTYCERIDVDAFDAQKHQQTKDLLKLLDEIIANQNLDLEKKEKILQQFRVTYPLIYEKRFAKAADVIFYDSAKSSNAPESANRNQGFISRLRRMVIE